MNNSRLKSPWAVINVSTRASVEITGVLYAPAKALAWGGRFSDECCKGACTLPSQTLVGMMG